MNIPTLYLIISLVAFIGFFIVNYRYKWLTKCDITGDAIVFIVIGSLLWPLVIIGLICWAIQTFIKMFMVPNDPPGKREKVEAERANYLD